MQERHLDGLRAFEMEFQLGNDGGQLVVKRRLSWKRELEEEGGIITVSHTLCGFAAQHPRGLTLAA
jgi:hypothetical protein